MEGYRRLSASEREVIGQRLGEGKNLSEIAHELGRARSTISREVKRGAGRTVLYRVLHAQRDAEERASKRRLGKRKLLKNRGLARIVHRKLSERWSPEQIAQWLKVRYAARHEMQISHETIYTYLYVLPRGRLKETLLRALRQGHDRRRKRREGSSTGSRPAITEMLSIEERPAEVADRAVPGHWEGDLLVGGQNQSALGTLVERTTRSLLLVPLKSKGATEVRKAFAREMKRLPKQMRLSLTYDQGKEMAEHKLFTKDTQIKVYFAHPRSPWERGTNENTNGLLRQFFPKGTDFDRLTRRQIKRVQHLMNGRPRKVLDWRTPYEAMQELLR